jgi:hypothetical protein
LTDDEGRSLWTVDELARELEDPGVGDHLDELHRSGLAPGLRLIQLIGRIV